jgi:hypothetical protein
MIRKAMLLAGAMLSLAPWNNAQAASKAHLVGRAAERRASRRAHFGQSYHVSRRDSRHLATSTTCAGSRCHSRYLPRSCLA